MTTAYLQDRMARSSSRSTGVVLAKNSLMPKLGSYLWRIWRSFRTKKCVPQLDRVLDYL